MKPSVEPSSILSVRLGAALGWGLLLLWLTIQLPLFLCQHLTSDAVIYDLQARCALEGGVLYRDILEPNFPGVVWVHMLVRTCLGWSPVVLRLVDLTILASIAVLLAYWRGSSSRSPWTHRVPWLLLALTGLYFSLSEWCHTQRDLWMLLPALGATGLRWRWIERCCQPEVHAADERGRISGKDVTLGLIEGFLWGLAVWLKPHVVLPGLCVILVSLPLAGRSRSTLLQLISVLAGGVIAGVAGSAWLMATGAWPYFWEMQLHWNPEYLRAGRSKMTWDRLLSLWRGFAPWGGMHLLAAGTVLWLTWRAASLSNRETESVAHSESDKTSWLSGWTRIEPSERGLILLAALYLGWMAQIFLLQHPFAYVHVPGLVLAAGILSCWNIPSRFHRMRNWGLAAFGIVALISSAAMQPTRLSAWSDCLRQGPVASVRSRIQIEVQPDWKELAPVIEFLQAQHLNDGELTAYSGGLIHLYPELGLRPPTRFVYLDVLARLFKSRTTEISTALASSRQRFVVSNLREAGMPEECLSREFDPRTGLPRCFPREHLADFPYTQPVVFRSGPYLVHRVERPLGRLCTDYFPLAQSRLNPVSDEHQASAGPRLSQAD